MLENSIIFKSVYYLQKICAKFCSHIRAAHQTLKEGESTVFAYVTNEKRQAVDTLNERLVALEILALPRRKVKTTLTVETDACDEQLSAVLMQK